MNDDWNDDRDERRPRGRAPWSSSGIWNGPGGWPTGPKGNGPGGQPGPPAWLTDLLGITPPPPKPPRPSRARRGDVRMAILDVLRRAHDAGETINGYQVIQRIADLSSDEWRPSPGSVYPTISQLQDEELVVSDETTGRRTIALSESGLAWVRSHTAELNDVWSSYPSRPAGTHAWADVTDDPSGHTTDAKSGPDADVKSEIPQVLSAVWQLVSQGSDSQRRAALDVLVQTRRALYGILADGRDGDGESRSK